MSYDARKVLEEHPEVTGVMKGEGEVTFLELAGFYLEGISELAKIEGITYRDGDQIQENPWRGITDLSTIPFVYKDLKNSKTVSFITSRAGAVRSPAATVSPRSTRNCGSGILNWSKRNYSFPGS